MNGKSTILLLQRSYSYTGRVARPTLATVVAHGKLLQRVPGGDVLSRKFVYAREDDLLSMCTWTSRELGRHPLGYISTVVGAASVSFG